MATDGQETDVFERGEPALAPRALWGVFAFALVFRFAVLALNLFWDIPPHWGPLPRTALTLAWSDLGGTALPPGFENLYQFSLDHALATWSLNDRGLIYLYLLVDTLTGKVTYPQIQGINLFVDALMVLPVMAIANRVSGNVGAKVSGIAYALFLPQVQMAASPDYNSWLTVWMVLITWAVIEIQGVRDRYKYLGLVALLVVFSFVGNEFRSILALYVIGAAGWLWLVSMAHKQSVKIQFFHWRNVSVLVLVGCLAFGLAASANKLARGEFSPVRSNLGHNFFTGVGQYENPLGMRNDDSVPVEWYTKETGRTDVNNTLGVEYNSWLMDRAIEFIRAHPGLYASMVLRRALSIVFPNMALTFVADLPSYTRQPDQAALIEERQKLVAENGWASPVTISRLMEIHPEYVISLAGRVALMLLLPIGLLCAFVFSNAKRVTFFACLPLAYIVICLAPYYVTPPIVTAAHGATLGVSMAGWTLAFSRFRNIVHEARKT